MHPPMFALDAPRALLAPSDALLRGFEFGPELPLATLSVVRPGAQTARLQGLQSRQGFRIGELNLMIGYADGSELTKMPVVHRLPNVPHWFAGMANLHGMLVPVFDLARHFGTERAPSSKQLLLVLAHGADAAGVAIDGLPVRLRFEEDGSPADQDLVPDALRDVIRRPVLIDGQLWFDLDCAALLARLERSLGAPQ